MEQENFVQYILRLTHTLIRIQLHKNFIFPWFQTKNAFCNKSLFRQSNAWHLIFFFQNHVHFLYFSIPVTNLCPGLQYEVQIAAYNNHGDGPSRSIFLHTNGKVYFVQLSRLIFYHSMLKKICKPWLLLKFQFSDSMIGFGEPYMITIHQLIPYMSVLWL